MSNEIERLRREQADRVMPVVGPLLDCLEGIDNDTRGALEELAPELFTHLANLQRAI